MPSLGHGAPWPYGWWWLASGNAQILRRGRCPHRPVGTDLNFTENVCISRREMYNPRAENVQSRVGAGIARPQNVPSITAVTGMKFAMIGWLTFYETPGGLWKYSAICENNRQFFWFLHTGGHCPPLRDVPIFCKRPPLRGECRFCDRFRILRVPSRGHGTPWPYGCIPRADVGIDPYARCLAVHRRASAPTQWF